MEPTPAGREDVVRLIDRLVDRRCHRVPIVRLVGPGGSGKAETLRYLQTRYSKTVPVARIDLSDMRADDTLSLIKVLNRQLGDFVNLRQFGRLRLPRTRLAIRSLQNTEDGDRSEFTREDARRLILAPRDSQDPLPERPDGPPPVAAAFQWLWLGLLAVLLLRRYRIQIPSVIRRILFPRSAAAWAWHERVGGPILDPNARARAMRVDDVIVEIRKASSDPDQWEKIDDLLVGAFLADICAAYRRRRFRRVRCVLLIGNADLLSAEANISLLDGKVMRHTRASLISRFVEMNERSCVHRRSTRHSALHPPLVMVLSSQAGPLPASGGTPQQRYRQWSSERKKNFDPFLILPMGCLSWRGTRSFLIKLSYRDDQTELRPLRASEIYSACRGHPHALTKVLAEENRSLRDSGTGLPVRQILSDRDVAQELLSRFLQRFPESGRVRQDTLDVLSVLSSANQIDARVATGLLRIRSPRPEGGSPTNGHIDSAFDAVHTTAEVARDAPDPSAASLGCTLKQRGSTPYSGVTGRLRISGDCARAAGADPATKLLIFQRVVGGPGNRSLQQLEFSGTP